MHIAKLYFMKLSASITTASLFYNLHIAIVKENETSFCNKPHNIQPAELAFVQDGKNELPALVKITLVY